jgi:hypothetical protein
MSLDPKNGQKTSECRALVPLAPRDERVGGVYHAEAPFIVQLSANVKGFAQYRAKRREKPEVGAQRYRTTVAEAIADLPKGSKLNYCA